MKLPHMKELRRKSIRGRDGKLLTHTFRISLSEDEAIAISLLFTSNRIENKPTQSLIRSFLVSQAIRKIDEAHLVKTMAELQVRSTMAEHLAQSIYDKVLHFMKTMK